MILRQSKRLNLCADVKPPPVDHQRQSDWKLRCSLRWNYSLSLGFTLTTKRTRIAHVALVEIHVSFRQIGSVNHRTGPAEVQVDVQIKFLGRDGGAQFLERRLRRLTTLETPQNLPTVSNAVRS